MPTQAELTIPKSRSEVVFYLVMHGAVVFFVMLAVFALFNGLAVIPSCLWAGLRPLRTR
jgi:hypothetical protein